MPDMICNSRINEHSKMMKWNENMAESIVNTPSILLFDIIMFLLEFKSYWVEI